MKKTSPVAQVLNSSYWDNARVIVLACGHRHVRPVSVVPAVGDAYPCYACDDGLPPWHDPDLEASLRPVDK